MPFQHFRLGSGCAVAVIAAGALLASPVAAVAATEETQSVVNDAKQRVEKGDLRGAEVQLRNAVRANPSDPGLHLDLAGIYLQMQNLPAAEVEARLAREDKGPADTVDPVLAQILLQENKLSELFRDVKPGEREAKAESEVRVTLGLGHLTLQEMDQADTLLHDAERLDDSGAQPKTAMAQFLLARHDLPGAQKEIAAANAIAPDDIAVMRVSALVLRAQGDSEAATAKVTALLANHPTDVTGLLIRADIYMGQNKLAEAQADLDRALKLAPNNVGVVFVDGVLLVRQGKLPEADAQLSKASTGFNNIPYGYYLQGVVKYRLGQYQQAAASLSKYSARFPKAVLPRQLIARVALSERNYSEVIDVLKPALESDPTDTTSAYLLAQAYFASGRRNEALELYQRAAQAKPNDPTSAAHLAEMEMQVGQVQRGLGELDKIAQTAEGAAVAGPPLVFADLSEGRISDAAAAAEALINRNGKDVVAQNLLGIVRMYQGNYSEAAAIFKRIADADPTLPAVQHALAQAYLAAGKLDDAKTVLQGLVKKWPSSLPDVIALALLEAQQKDEAGAAVLLKQAQQNAPKDPSPGLALLRIYGTAKEWDKAQTYGRELEGEFPANPALIDMLASLRAAAGDPKGAAAEYAELVQALPDEPDALVNYATYQNAANDKAGARASLMQAHALAPHDLQYMEHVVAFDMAAGGADAALATAQSFAKDEPQKSQLLAADVLEKSKRADEAVVLLAAEQQQNPSGPIAAKLGEVLYAAGKHDEAKRLLQSWIKDHDDLGPRLALANIFLAERDDNDAQALYEQVHDKMPDDVMALNNLAWIYEKNQDSRALDYAAQAYRLAPRPDTADTLGWILLGNGKSTEALSLLRAASAGLPLQAAVQYHLAAALSAAGQKDQARSVLEKLMRSGAAFDNQADAQHLLATLQHD